jgi:MFS family permease
MLATENTAPARPEGATRALGLLALALVLAMTTWFSASAVIPQLRSAWDLSDTSAAWLTIAVQLGFVAGALASALLTLSDVIRPRLLICGGAAGAATVNLLLAIAGGPGWGIPLRFLTGAFLAGVYPPALKLMSTWFVRGRGVALGILVGALTLGSAVPHLVNGLGGLEWKMVIYATSALTLAGGLIVLFLVGDGPFAFPTAVFDIGQARRVLADRGVRLASLGYFGHMWELYAMWAWFLVFFRAHLEASGGASQRAASYVTFLVIGIGALGCWVGGILGDRWGRTRTTAAAMIVSGACTVVIGSLFGAPTWIVVVVGCIWGFAVVADSAQFSTMVTELADQAYVGTALTLQLALGFTLTVATIWLLPLVETEVGWRWAFVLLLPGPVVGATAMIRLLRSPYSARIAGGRG